MICALFSIEIPPCSSSGSNDERTQINRWLLVKKTASKGKTAKDPNKPKRPASAFFVFMEEFRKQYKEENPENKFVAAVVKAGGAKWNSLSESVGESTFSTKSDKRKKQYEKDMDTYNNKPAASANDEADDDLDKSKSEVNDEGDSDSGDDEDDD